MAPGSTGRLWSIESEIRQEISRDLSRRHVPEYIFEDESIPYNMNGKKLEIPVKLLLCHGRAARKTKVGFGEEEALAQYEKYYEIEKEAAGGRRARL